MKKLLLAVTVLVMALAPLAHAAVKSIVLVHGAFADGSGWKPVAGLLEHDGYTVYIVQEPETSFEADVAATWVPQKSRKVGKREKSGWNRAAANFSRNFGFPRVENPWDRSLPTAGLTGGAGRPSAHEGRE
jgi:hypothetical protein